MRRNGCGPGCGTFFRHIKVGNSQPRSCGTILPSERRRRALMPSGSPIRAGSRPCGMLAEAQRESSRPEEAAGGARSRFYADSAIPPQVIVDGYGPKVDALIRCLTHEDSVAEYVTVGTGPGARIQFQVGFRMFRVPNRDSGISADAWVPPPTGTSCRTVEPNLEPGSWNPEPSPIDRCPTCLRHTLCHGTGHLVLKVWARMLVDDELVSLTYGV